MKKQANESATRAICVAAAMALVPLTGKSDILTVEKGSPVTITEGQKASNNACMAK